MTILAKRDGDKILVAELMMDSLLWFLYLPAVGLLITLYALKAIK